MRGRSNRNMIDIKHDQKKVTDLDYLQKLSKGKKDFVQEMIHTFLVENPKEIELLEKAIRSENVDDIRQTAHFLQSSIPFVGLDKIIEEEVYEIERIAGSKSLAKRVEILSTDYAALEKIETLFAKIKDVCERAWHELNNLPE